MDKIKYLAFLFFLTAQVLRAQVEIGIGSDTVKVEPGTDTLTVEVAEAPLKQDSVQTKSLLPSDLEYIPAGESDLLIADRLSCIQQKINLDYNEKVQAFINYFTIRDREYSRMVLRRKAVYFPLFEKHLAKNNLPDELKYLSIIESGLNPHAVSRARAVGLWQFMSGTGKYMGLRNDWYIDERMDPEKATIAACKYLTMLYSMFNDWQLALAAYNSGPGTVKRAIRLSGYKKTFWEVYPFLPRETRAYVPQYIAMIYTMNYSEIHNLTEFSLESLPSYDTLLTTRSFNFETFATLTGSCVEDLQKLNPSVLHNFVPAGRSVLLKIPASARLAMALNRTSILDSSAKGNVREREMLIQPGTGSTYGREMIVYKVKSGDGLGSIAQRHNVRVGDLQKWNNLSSNMIHPGRLLNIWILPSSKVASVSPAPSTIAPTSENGLYTVQPGDTLWDISRKFQGLTIEKIKTLNNLKSNKLKPGQKLIVG